MTVKTAHEPDAPVMSAEDVAQDAQQLAKILRQNLQKGEPAVQLKVPLSAYLDALDNLDRDELLLLRRRIEDKLAA